MNGSITTAERAAMAAASAHAGAFVEEPARARPRLIHQKLVAASFLVDLALVVAAMFLAYYIRFETAIVRVGVADENVTLESYFGHIAFGVGVLIAALTAGAAMPHLINAVPLGGSGGMPAWQSVLQLTSLFGFIAAAVALGPIRCGPYSAHRAPFNPRYLVRIFRDRPLRLVNFGYLGHM